MMLFRTTCACCKQDSGRASGIQPAPTGTQSPDVAVTAAVDGSNEYMLVLVDAAGINVTKINGGAHKLKSQLKRPRMFD